MIISRIRGDFTTLSNVVELIVADTANDQLRTSTPLSLPYEDTRYLRVGQTARASITSRAANAAANEPNHLNRRLIPRRQKIQRAPRELFYDVDAVSTFCRKS